MSSINFEEDQAKVITKTENIRSLADQVERLEHLQEDVKLREENLKNLKKKLEHLSGEIIPTMMSEMGLSHLSKLNFPLVISETIEHATPMIAGSPVNNKKS